MRLTLRTLLAWRDGLLSPSEHAELSEKMKTASIARNLLDRMRSLEQRSDVEVPKVEGRGLAADANSVAEYLENVLEPEKLEAFEQICLSSDRHLAEISECHQILAAQQPDAASDELSQAELCKAIAGRLEGSGWASQAENPFPSQIPSQSVAPETGAPRQPSIPQARIKQTAEGVAAELQSAVVKEAAAKQPAGRTRRAQRRGSPWLQAAAAISLLGLSVGGLTVAVRWDSPEGQQAQEPAEAVRLPAEAPPSVPSEDPPPAEPDQSHQAAAVVAASPEVAPPPLIDEEDVSASGSPSAEAVASAGPDPVAPEPPLGSGPTVPMGGALAIAAPLAPNPESLLPPIPAPEPPAVAGAAAAAAVDGPPSQKTRGVVSDGPLLLVSEVDQPSRWRGCFPGALLESGMQLLAPPASEPELAFGSVSVRLAPRSQLVVHESGDDCIDIELLFGCAAVRRRTGDAEVVLRAGGLKGRLSGAPGAVAVRVSLSCQPSREQAPGSDGQVTASLDFIEGEMTWTYLDGSARIAGMPSGGELPSGISIVWSSLNADQATRGEATVRSWEAFSQPVNRLAEEAVFQLAEAVRAEGDVTAAARRTASSSRVECREVAAGTLALIGDYSEAVAILCNAAIGERLGERRWRFFEREVIPLAIARGVHSAERLRKAFAEELPGGNGERVYQLACGFSNERLEAGGDRELVNALDDPQLVVRRYAAMQLEELVKISPRDQLRYRADAEANLRAEGVRWWQMQLEKGLIRRQDAGQLSVPEPG